MFEKTKKITPKALKVYKKLGLLDIKPDDDGQDVGAKVLDIFMDEKELKQIVDVTFDYDFSDVDMEEVDITALSEGIFSFLSQLPKG